MLKIISSCLVSLLVTSVVCAADAEKARGGDSRVFEMRTYYAAPGKFEAMQARFRDHACKLFEKHGIANIGYWTPVENPDNKLIYIIAFPDADARAKSWKAFMADPDWRAAFEASEKEGKLVAKLESVVMKATDFSPELKPVAAAEARAFELRIYKCTAGNLPNLLARFRDHTLELFKKHGMTNIGYFTPVEKGQGAEDTLIYILAHKSQEAAAESFKNFRADPQWLAARKASEDKAGGSLTQADGVKSKFMKATNFSPMK